MSCSIRPLIVIGFSVVFVSSLAAQERPSSIRFVDVSTACGIEAYSSPEGMGAGLLAADYDGDGDVDLFAPTGEGTPDQLYRNLGDGTFEEIAALVGLDSVRRHRAALFFDYDNDDDLDLIIGHDDQPADPVQSSSFQLFRQDSPTSFHDVTAEAGLFRQARASGLLAHRSGFAAGDLDRDGDLDLYATMWNGEANLFRNEGNGTFVDISAASGIAHTFPVTQWQPIIGDFDGDGWQDIFVAVDFFDNLLWVNQRDGTFVNQAQEAGCNHSMNGMGAACNDIDGDGDLDLAVTNIHDYKGFGERNLMLLNASKRGSFRFGDVSTAVGVADGGWGWGVTLFDADCDGHVDWASTNGFETAPWMTDTTRFYFGRPDVSGEAIEASKQVGLADPDWGSALISFDLDRDGDLDLGQTCMGGPLRVLENVPAAGPGRAVAPGGYLVVQPRQVQGNRRGIGAIVSIRIGGRWSSRLITAGTSFLSQEPAEAHFGLGRASQVDRVRVQFPDGTVTSLTNVAANQTISVFP